MSRIPIQEVKLCEKCAPLLARPELDTLGRVRAKLCARCRLALELARRKQRMNRAEDVERARARVVMFEYEGPGGAPLDAALRLLESGKPER